MKPYKIQGIGRVIGIKYSFKSVEGFFFFVECDVNRVVKLLLPVLAAGNEGKQDNGNEDD